MFKSKNQNCVIMLKLLTSGMCLAEANQSDNCTSNIHRDKHVLKMNHSIQASLLWILNIMFLSFMYTLVLFIVQFYCWIIKMSESENHWYKDHLSVEWMYTYRMYLNCASTHVCRLALQVLIPLLLFDLVKGRAGLRAGAERLSCPVVNQLVQVSSERLLFVIAVVGLSLSECCEWLRIRYRHGNRRQCWLLIGCWAYWSCSTAIWWP